MIEIKQGNSLEILPTLTGRHNFMFTSPPYNRKRNDKYNFYDDKVDWKELITKIVDWGMENTDYVFLNIQKNYYNKKEVFELMGQYAGNIVEMLVWEKTNPMPASGASITNSYEYILVFNKDGNPLKSTHTYTKNHYETPVFSNNPYKDVHRAVMNPELARMVMTDYMSAGESVIDPFNGVGTTGLIAKEIGLNYTGIELVPEYVELTKERLEIN